MTSGGLYHLDINSDNFTNINPEITFFKKVIKKPTCFCMIENEYNILGSNKNEEHELEIRKNADLLQDIIFKIEIPNTKIQQFSQKIVINNHFNEFVLEHSFIDSNYNIESIYYRNIYTDEWFIIPKIFLTNTIREYVIENSDNNVFYNTISNYIKLIKENIIVKLVTNNISLNNSHLLNHINLIEYKTLISLIKKSEYVINNQVYFSNIFNEYIDIIFNKYIDNYILLRYQNLLQFRNNKNNELYKHYFGDYKINEGFDIDILYEYTTKNMLNFEEYKKNIYNNVLIIKFILFFLYSNNRIKYTLWKRYKLNEFNNVINSPVQNDYNTFLNEWNNNFNNIFGNYSNVSNLIFDNFKLNYTNAMNSIIYDFNQINISDKQILYIKLKKITDVFKNNTIVSILNSIFSIADFTNLFDITLNDVNNYTFLSKTNNNADYIYPVNIENIFIVITLTITNAFLSLSNDIQVTFLTWVKRIINRSYISYSYYSNIVIDNASDMLFYYSIIPHNMFTLSDFYESYTNMFNKTSFIGIIKNQLNATYFNCNGTDTFNNIVNIEIINTEDIENYNLINNNELYIKYNNGYVKDNTEIQVIINNVIQAYSTVEYLYFDNTYQFKVLLKNKVTINSLSVKTIYTKKVPYLYLTDDFLTFIEHDIYTNPVTKDINKLDVNFNNICIVKNNDTYRLISSFEELILYDEKIYEYNNIYTVITDFSVTNNILEIQNMDLSEFYYLILKNNKKVYYKVLENNYSIAHIGDITNYILVKLNNVFIPLDNFINTNNEINGLKLHPAENFLFSEELVVYSGDYKRLYFMNIPMNINNDTIIKINNISSDFMCDIPFSLFSNILSTNMTNVFKIKNLITDTLSNNDDYNIFINIINNTNNKYKSMVTNTLNDISGITSRTILDNISYSPTNLHSKFKFNVSDPQYRYLPRIFNEYNSRSIIENDIPYLDYVYEYFIKHLEYINNNISILYSINTKKYINNIQYSNMLMEENNLFNNVKVTGLNLMYPLPSNDITGYKIKNNNYTEVPSDYIVYDNHFISEQVVKKHKKFEYVGIYFTYNIFDSIDFIKYNYLMIDNRNIYNIQNLNFPSKIVVTNPVFISLEESIETSLVLESYTKHIYIVVLHLNELDNYLLNVSTINLCVNTIYCHGTFNKISNNKYELTIFSDTVISFISTIFYKKNKWIHIDIDNVTISRYLLSTNRYNNSSRLILNESVIKTNNELYMSDYFLSKNNFYYFESDDIKILNNVNIIYSESILISNNTITKNTNIDLSIYENNAYCLLYVNGNYKIITIYDLLNINEGNYHIWLCDTIRYIYNDKQINSFYKIGNNISYYTIPPTNDNCVRVDNRLFKNKHWNNINKYNNNTSPNIYSITTFLDYKYEYKIRYYNSTLNIYSYTSHIKKVSIKNKIDNINIVTLNIGAFSDNFDTIIVYRTECNNSVFYKQGEYSILTRTIVDNITDSQLLSNDIFVDFNININYNIIYKIFKYDYIFFTEGKYIHKSVNASDIIDFDNTNLINISNKIDKLYRTKANMSEYYEVPFQVTNNKFIIDDVNDSMLTVLKNFIKPSISNITISKYNNHINNYFNGSIKYLYRNNNYYSFYLNINCVEYNSIFMSNFDTVSTNNIDIFRSIDNGPFTLFKTIKYDDILIDTIVSENLIDTNDVLTIPTFNIDLIEYVYKYRFYTVDNLKTLYSSDYQSEIITLNGYIQNNNPVTLTNTNNNVDIIIFRTNANEEIYYFLDIMKTTYVDNFTILNNQTDITKRIIQINDTNYFSNDSLIFGNYSIQYNIPITTVDLYFNYSNNTLLSEKYTYNVKNNIITLDFSNYSNDIIVNYYNNEIYIQKTISNGGIYVNNINNFDLTNKVTILKPFDYSIIDRSYEYKYKIEYANTITNARSIESDIITYKSSVILNDQNKVVLSNIPINEYINLYDSVNIYRTDYNSNSFYLLGNYIKTETFIDDITTSDDYIYELDEIYIDNNPNKIINLFDFTLLNNDLDIESDVLYSQEIYKNNEIEFNIDQITDVTFQNYTKIKIYKNKKLFDIIDKTTSIYYALSNYNAFSNFKQENFITFSADTIQYTYTYLIKSDILSKTILSDYIQVTSDYKIDNDKTILLDNIVNDTTLNAPYIYRSVGNNVFKELGQLINNSFSDNNSDNDVLLFDSLLMRSNLSISDFFINNTYYYYYRIGNSVFSVNNIQIDLFNKVVINIQGLNVNESISVFRTKVNTPGVYYNIGVFNYGQNNFIDDVPDSHLVTQSNTIENINITSNYVKLVNNNVYTYNYKIRVNDSTGSLIYINPSIEITTTNEISNNTIINIDFTNLFNSNTIHSVFLYRSTYTDKHTFYLLDQITPTNLIYPDNKLDTDIIYNTRLDDNTHIIISDDLSISYGYEKLNVLRNVIDGSVISFDVSIELNSNIYTYNGSLILINSKTPFVTINSIDYYRFISTSILISTHISVSEHVIIENGSILINKQIIEPNIQKLFGINNVNIEYFWVLYSDNDEELFNYYSLENELSLTSPFITYDHEVIENKNINDLSIYEYTSINTNNINNIKELTYNNIFNIKPLIDDEKGIYVNSIITIIRNDNEYYLTSSDDLYIEPTEIIYLDNWIKCKILNSLENNYFLVSLYDDINKIEFSYTSYGYYTIGLTITNLLDIPVITINDRFYYNDIYDLEPGDCYLENNLFIVNTITLQKNNIYMLNKTFSNIKLFNNNSKLFNLNENLLINLYDILIETSTGNVLLITDVNNNVLNYSSRYNITTNDFILPYQPFELIYVEIVNGKIINTTLDNIDFVIIDVDVIQTEFKVYSIKNNYIHYNKIKSNISKNTWIKYTTIKDINNYDNILEINNYSPSISNIDYPIKTDIIRVFDKYIIPIEYLYMSNIYYKQGIKINGMYTNIQDIENIDNYILIKNTDNILTNSSNSVITLSDDLLYSRFYVINNIPVNITNKFEHISYTDDIIKFILYLDKIVSVEICQLDTITSEDSNDIYFNDNIRIKINNAIIYDYELTIDEYYILNDSNNIIYLIKLGYKNELIPFTEIQLTDDIYYINKIYPCKLYSENNKIYFNLLDMTINNISYYKMKNENPIHIIYTVPITINSLLIPYNNGFIQEIITEDIYFNLFKTIKIIEINKVDYKFFISSNKIFVICNNELPKVTKINLKMLNYVISSNNEYTSTRQIDVNNEYIQYNINVTKNSTNDQLYAIDSLDQVNRKIEKNTRIDNRFIYITSNLIDNIYVTSEPLELTSNTVKIWNVHKNNKPILNIFNDMISINIKNRFTNIVSIQELYNLCKPWGRWAMHVSNVPDLFYVNGYLKWTSIIEIKNDNINYNNYITHEEYNKMCKLLILINKDNNYYNSYIKTIEIEKIFFDNIKNIILDPSFYNNVINNINEFIKNNTIHNIVFDGNNLLVDNINVTDFYLSNEYTYIATDNILYKNTDATNKFDINYNKPYGISITVLLKKLIEISEQYKDIYTNIVNYGTKQIDILESFSDNLKTRIFNNDLVNSYNIILYYTNHIIFTDITCVEIISQQKHSIKKDILYSFNSISYKDSYNLLSNDIILPRTFKKYDITNTFIGKRLNITFNGFDFTNINLFEFNNRILSNVTKIKHNIYFNNTYKILTNNLKMVQYSNIQKQIRLNGRTYISFINSIYFIPDSTYIISSSYFILLEMDEYNNYYIDIDTKISELNIQIVYLVEEGNIYNITIPVQCMLHNNKILCVYKKEIIFENRVIVTPDSPYNVKFNINNIEPNNYLFENYTIYNNNISTFVSQEINKYTLISTNSYITCTNTNEDVYSIKINNDTIPDNINNLYLFNNNSLINYITYEYVDSTTINYSVNSNDNVDNVDIVYNKILSISNTFRINNCIKSNDFIYYIDNLSVNMSNITSCELYINFNKIINFRFNDKIYASTNFTISNQDNVYIEFSYIVSVINNKIILPKSFIHNNYYEYYINKLPFDIKNLNTTLPDDNYTLSINISIKYENIHLLVNHFRYDIELNKHFIVNDAKYYIVPSIALNVLNNDELQTYPYCYNIDLSDLISYNDEDIIVLIDDKNMLHESIIIDVNKIATKNKLLNTIIFYKYSNINYAIQYLEYIGLMFNEFIYSNNFNNNISIICDTDITHNYEIIEYHEYNKTNKHKLNTFEQSYEINNANNVNSKIDPLNIFEYIRLYLDNNMIEELNKETYDYMYLKYSDNKKRSFDNMIKLRPSGDNYSIYLPLSFWFTHNIGLALPVQGLNKTRISLRYKLNYNLSKLKILQKNILLDLSESENFINNTIEQFIYTNFVFPVKFNNSLNSIFTYSLNRRIKDIVLLVDSDEKIMSYDPLFSIFIQHEEYIESNVYNINYECKYFNEINIIKEINELYYNYTVYKIDINNEITNIKNFINYSPKLTTQLIKFLLYYSRTYLKEMNNKLLLMKEYVDKHHFITEEINYDIIEKIKMDVGITSIVKEINGSYLNKLVPQKYYKTTLSGRNMYIYPFSNSIDDSILTYKNFLGSEKLQINVLSKKPNYRVYLLVRELQKMTIKEGKFFLE